MLQKSALILLPLWLSACVTEGTVWKPTTPSRLVADTWDDGSKPTFLTNGNAAIVYDPQGCQHWIIDDGEEGYSTPRFNPQTGLPVCDNRYPPGTIVGEIERPTDEVPDFVPNGRVRPRD